MSKEVNRESYALIIAEFSAYGSDSKEVFINKTKDEVLSALFDICSTMHLYKLTYWEAYPLGTDLVNEKFEIKTDASEKALKKEEEE